MEHLNRCKTSLVNLTCRGTWHTIRDHVQRSYLIVWDTEPDQLCVPALFDFLVHGDRLSPEPDKGLIWMISPSARLSQSDDYFYFGYLDRYLYTSVHFRMLSSGWVTSLWSLFSFSYFYPGNSDDYFEKDSLGSRSSLVGCACTGFSSQLIR